MPVGTSESKIFPVSDILTHFASEAKNLGRFEEEVWEVALLLEKINRRTLVLFNETFQSTVCAEIAVPLKAILDALVSAGTYTGTVSHNEFFLDICKMDSKTALHRIGNDHSLIFLPDTV